MNQVAPKTRLAVKSAIVAVTVWAGIYELGSQGHILDRFTLIAAGLAFWGVVALIVKLSTD
jgi:hypothetical protein